MALGYFNTQVDEDQNNIEIRLHQQLLRKDQIHRYLIHNRLRIEERWILNPDENIFKLRASYALGIIVPINHKNIQKDTWISGIINEVFIHWAGDFQQQYYDRNRLMGVLGYHFTPNLGIRLHYTWESSASASNSIFWFSVRHKF